MKRIQYILFFLYMLFIHSISANAVLARQPWQNDPFREQSVDPNMATTIIPVHFLRAAKLAKLLASKKLMLLSPYAEIANDDQRLYITDKMNNIKRIKQFISAIDHAAPQILIQAQIIHVDSDFSRSFGLELSTEAAKSNPNHALNFAWPMITNHAANFSFPLFVFNHQLLNIELSALEEAGHAKLLSNPQLITLNNHPAIIESGEEVPYQESTANGATSVRFKKAVLRLQVTPQIMPHHKILLTLKINQDKVSDLSINGIPAITTQQIQTQLLIKNNQTFILGGIMEKSHTQKNVSVPILSRIPIIGKLFQHTGTTQQQRELLIIITPTILSAI